MNRGLPIVFVLVTDPLFSGFVQNLGRPGGNVTGFSVFESSVGSKWLALLKEAARRSPRSRCCSIPRLRPSRRVIDDQRDGRDFRKRRDL